MIYCVSQQVNPDLYYRDTEFVDLFVSIIGLTINKSINSASQAVADITGYDRVQLACCGIVYLAPFGLHDAAVMGPNSPGAEWIE